MADPIARDGSPVELYRLLSPGGEPELIHAAVPPGCALLELGCGVGRVTHALLALGHPVVAVDQSPAMLAHVRGAETVLADVETLDLDRQFAGVVFASNLINVALAEKRRAFLQTCRRHVTDDGVVLVERYDPAWIAGVPEVEVSRDGVQIALHPLRQEGPRFSAVVEYRAGDRYWKQTFAAEVLDDPAVTRELAAAGLQVRRWLGHRHTWIVAAPA